MIDASNCFIKDGSKNRLRAQDIHKIVDAFSRHLQIDRYSRMVPLAEISDPKNDFNLNLPRYIDSSEPEDLQDIDAHLRGGIPNHDIDDLQSYWQVLPAVRATLFKNGDRLRLYTAQSRTRRHQSRDIWPYGIRGIQSISDHPLREMEEVQHPAS
jgi:type I restriction enzyme M protein